MAKKTKSDQKPKPSAETEGKEKIGNYVVFARRFRPNTFSEVVGQPAVTNALRQALASGRLAQAYLFCGPRGVGKTSLARIVAKAINCLNGKGPGGVAEEPCNTCDACVAIQEGRALDVIEMDAATNRGIEEVRALRDNVGLAPAERRYKVYIIDEVHMLTREAWNAFLKTLEEPPAHVKFIFATTDPNNVPETILSRCQRYDLRRIGPADIVKRLKQICAQEKIEYDEMALSRIAGLARGGLRDAEGLLDQAVNLSQGQVTDAIVRDLSGAAPDELILDILKACAQSQTTDALAKAHQALEAGADPEDTLDALVERLRGTLLAKVCGADSTLLEGQTHLKDAYAELGGMLSEDQILMLVQLFTTARRQMRDAAQTRLPLEMALIRAARAGELVDLGKLVSALEAGAAARPPPKAEGPRPNSPGRSGTVDLRPAAESVKPVVAAAASGSVTQAAPAPGPDGAEIRARLVAAARAQKGGALLASALTYASVIKLDSAAGSLTLGFAPDQLFYTDTLEKPDTQAALQTILTATLGQAFKIAVQRLSAAEAAKSGPRASAPAATATRTARSADVDVDAGGEETEIEFDGVDELPLRVPAPPAPSDEAAVQTVDGDETGIEAPPQRPPLPVLPKAAGARNAPKNVPAVDLEEVKKHPLLQMVLKETGGVVIDVRRETAKSSAGKSGKGK